MNAEDSQGRFCEEINSETKYSPLARGFMYAGAAVGGTIAAPFVAPVLAVAAIHEAGKDGSMGGNEAFVAATPVFSTIGAPLIGGVFAYGVHGALKSDDFSDED